MTTGNKYVTQIIIPMPWMLFCGFIDTNQEFAILQLVWVNTIGYETDMAFSISWVMLQNVCRMSFNVEHIGFVSTCKAYD